MKKLLAALVALFMVFSLTGCGNTNNEPKGTESPVTTTEPAETEETLEPIAAEDVISHEEYIAAELDTKVVIEAYVQDHQSWWDNKITVYAQDEDGAYFLYNLACSEEDAEKLVPGTKIRVEGYKGEWAGEVEIMDGRFEIIEGNFVAEPFDATELLGSEDLIKRQNEKVAFSGLTIEPSTDAEGNEVAFLYNYDGSGAHESNSDLYFNASYNGETYSFCVESYLRGNDSEVYAAVEALEIGDVVDLEGFLYWYEGAQTHVTNVTVK